MDRFLCKNALADVVGFLGDIVCMGLPIKFTLNTWSLLSIYSFVNCVEDPVMYHVLCVCNVFLCV